MIGSTAAFSSALGQSNRVLDATSRQDAEATQSSAADLAKLKESDATRETFQEFVAGTFFQQMFKAMRQAEKKPKYFHGGQAEEVFQSQMDQQLSTELAKSHGEAFSSRLYDPFIEHVRQRIRDSANVSGLERIRQNA